MKIGKLRHQITIQQNTRSSDGSGGYSYTWSTFATIWGSVSPPNARQRFFADRLEHNITHVVVIRYMSGITSDMRISHDGRYLQIHGIRNPDERGISLELMCEEGQAS